MSCSGGCRRLCLLLRHREFAKALTHPSLRGAACGHDGAAWEQALRTGHWRTECFMYFSAHVLTHFSSVAVSALLRKETTHSQKQRSTSPLNMRSVSLSCISSSFISMAAQRVGREAVKLGECAARGRAGRTLLLRVAALLEGLGDGVHSRPGLRGGGFLRTCSAGSASLRVADLSSCK